MDGKITGKARGGKARAAALSPEKRKEISKKASSARWDNSVLRVTHGGENKPLRIGGSEIPCYVLSDGRRVLGQRPMAATIGLSDTGGQRISTFLRAKCFSEFVTKELIEKIENPIVFKSIQGKDAHGYDGSILIDICDVILAARKAKKLSNHQILFAEKCEILVRSVAKVGIIALIDEATGYQEIRTRDSLSKILEAFITNELQPWIKKFPPAFYKEMFRLRGLTFSPDNIKRPQYFGYLTNDIIYKRLAPGVLKALKEKTPKNSSGRTAHRLHQHLTPEIGDPKLRDHITSVITIMKLSETWENFEEKLNKILPIQIEQNSDDNLLFEDDFGKGL